MVFCMDRAQLATHGLPELLLGQGVEIMRNSILVLALASATMGLPAAAQADPQVDARYTAAFKTCIKTGEAARGVTSAMMSCLGEENDRQDVRLNGAYKAAMKRLGGAQKTKLRAGQRAWIGQRDSTCTKTAEEAGGGSMSGIVYSNCFLDETIKRTIWLERHKG